MTIEPQPLTAERFWIVFDGPPGPESCRFVEVENDQHESRGLSSTGANWQQDSETYWRLGPFVSHAALLYAEQRIAELEGECIAAERRAHALNEQIEPLIAERTQRIREERDDLRAENERLRTTSGGVP